MTVKSNLCHQVTSAYAEINKLLIMKKQSIRSLILTSIFAAIISVLAPITIPVGTVPITLSLFAVFLCGSLLPTAQAVMATIVYITLGAIGLPVFSSYTGGFSVLTGVTGGFIWAYPLMAFSISLSVKIFKKRCALSLFTGICIAIIICYTLGTFWFCYLTGNSLTTGITACVLPFIVPDVIKAVAAASLALGLDRFYVINKKLT